MKTIIYADNMLQAKQYASVKGLQKSEWIYLSDFITLLGRCDCNLIKTGTWYANTQINNDKVEQYCKSHNINMSEDYY